LLMKMLENSDLEVLYRVSDLWQETVFAIGDDQWGLPTPCTEWDVGQLVDHVIGGNWFTIAILEGQSADTAMASAINSFTAGLDRAATAATTTRAQRDLLGTAGMLDGRYSHTAGELTGGDVLRLRLHDLIIHHWDLGQALHPPAMIDDDLVSWALSDLAAPDSLPATHFELPVPAPGNGRDRHTRLLAAFGRRT
jgi:uncharacterized protein (TIGR03086 family)